MGPDEYEEYIYFYVNRFFYDEIKDSKYIRKADPEGQANGLEYNYVLPTCTVNIFAENFSSSYDGDIKYKWNW